MKREFDLLNEEKAYWQNQALEARDLVEKQAAVIRAARSDEEKHEEIYKRHLERDQAAQKVIKALATAADITLPAFNLPLATPKFVEDLLITIAEQVKARTADEMPEYFHVAWYGNGGPYMDARKLTREDAVKNRAIFKPGGKIKLYARVPK